MPWLLKAEKLTFVGSNFEPTFLADYLGRLLGTKLIAKTESAAPINVSDFTGTVEELLDPRRAPRRGLPSTLDGLRKGRRIRECAPAARVSSAGPTTGTPQAT